jgi:hypothetical protein
MSKNQVATKTRCFLVSTMLFWKGVIQQELIDVFVWISPG